MNLPDGVRAELIEGELFMSPSPKRRHQRISANLSSILRAHVITNKLGEVLYAPLDVHLPSGDIVQPDVIFVSSGNQNILQDWIRGVPDLLVEVVSPEGAERDRIIKRDLYARNGVREYWLVDDGSASVEVLKLEGSTFTSHGYFEKDDIVTSTVLADLALPVREILA